MKVKKYLVAVCVCLSVHFVMAQSTFSPVDYVNPLIGTDSEYALSNGNTYPAIARPWGMNFWTPQTRKMGDGWQYAYRDYKINGFKQTHQPSPWINDYGQFAIMPTVGALRYSQEERASWYSHKAEVVTPYYYRAYLADYDLVTEITPTERAAIFRFTFPETSQANVIVDAFDNNSYAKIIPEKNAIIGYTTKNSGGVPQNFKNYFVIRFDKPFQSHKVVVENLAEQVKTTAVNNRAYAMVTFSTQRNERVTARVASSFISYDQAWQNLKEVENRDFEEIKSEGHQVWNEVLGKIEVSGGSLDQLRTFYSALYRSTLFPRKFYEIDKLGNILHYSPFNGKVLPGYLYTDTGFWDTFRSLFPLLNLVYPSINLEIQEGLLNTYLESGFLPEWASPGHRDCMVGNNSASVVADAYLKGVKIENIEKLYEGLLHGANNVHPQVSSTGRLGYRYYNQLGYVPYDVKINENAARTLEYAFNDWSIYQLGKALNRPRAELEVCAKRSQNYRNLFSKEYNLMRGRNTDGTFQSPFNPTKWGDAFTEGNSWHYTWSVFHDPEGLIDLMGGRKTFVTMLDSVFKMPPIFDDSYYGSVIHEIREMQIMNMGQYAHGNQPIQHMIYLYNYAGEPWKTQYWVREVMTRLYKPSPDGYCGDEDNGQTSAWYVFSAMGFYPVCPGSNEYVLGAPLFENVKIKLENGRTVEINAKDNETNKPYIQNLFFNGESYSKNFLKHDDLWKGAKIDVQMSSQPNFERGTQSSDFPYSFSNKHP